MSNLIEVTTNEPILALHTKVKANNRIEKNRSTVHS